MTSALLGEGSQIMFHHSSIMSCPEIRALDQDLQGHSTCLHGESQDVFFQKEQRKTKMRMRLIVQYGWCSLQKLIFPKPVSFHAVPSLGNVSMV